jgi:leucyl aminopeptidase
MKVNFIKENSKSNNIKILVISKEVFDKTKDKAILDSKNNHDFKAKNSQIIQIATNSQILILAGIGEEKKIDDLSAQKLGGNIAAFLNRAKIKSAQIDILSQIGKNPLSDADFAANIAFGANLQTYRFNKYFNDKKEGKESLIQDLSIEVNDIKKSKEEYNKLEIVAENIAFARDLVSEPSNVLTPPNYAKICQNLTSLGLEVEVLGEAEMKKLNMNSLLAVGQGSSQESKLVILKWNGAKDKNEQPIAFVGKGVTFDTGGISIKPSLNMEDMKTDMGGSAVVVSLLRLLAQRKANVNAVGVVGLTENMPAGNAQKPGDVVSSMSGQTIEVINTDAEGRMVLADALHYTNVNFKPKFIVDLATLTGAIIVALADVHAGLFSNDDKLSKQINDSGLKTGETVWRLPVSDVYDKMINSDIADMKNVGSGRGAGSTTAAQFLHRFIGKTPWAHLDIAGVAWEGKGNAVAVKGASGYGVKLLNHLVAENYEN